MNSKEEYKYEPHNFKKKVLNYQCCVHCGLLTLKINLQSGVFSKDVTSEITQAILTKECSTQNYLIEDDYECKRIKKVSG
jgi:hypothetical protein